VGNTLGGASSSGRGLAPLVTTDLVIPDQAVVLSSHQIHPLGTTVSRDTVSPTGKVSWCWLMAIE
jgi:hypothetical protein